MVGINSYFTSQNAGRYLAQLFAALAQEGQGTGGLTLPKAATLAGTTSAISETVSRIVFEAALLASQLNGSGGGGGAAESGAATAQALSARGSTAAAAGTAAAGTAASQPSALAKSVMQLAGEWADIAASGSNFTQSTDARTYASGASVETWAFDALGATGNTDVTEIGGGVIWGRSADASLSGIVVTTKEADDVFQVVSTDKRVVSVDSGAGNDVISIAAQQALVVDAGAGDDVVDIAGSARDVRGGGGGDTITVSEGSASGIGGGAGDDAITLSGRSAKQDVYGGAGADSLDIASDFSVAGIYGDHNAWEFGKPALDSNKALYGRSEFETDASGEGGDDRISITLTARALPPGSTAQPLPGTISTVEAGAGNDQVTIRGQAYVSKIGGGAGDDVIDIQGFDVSDVRGGTGDDRITVDAQTAGLIRGGTGDDTITLNTRGAGLVFAKGDGSDTVTIVGRTEIAFESLSTDDATISRDSNTITIAFASGERITVNHAFGDFDGDAPTLTLNGGSLVIS